MPTPGSYTPLPHTEARPKSGVIGEAAQAVASHCLLPDPRSTGRRTWDTVTNFWRPSVWRDEKACTAYEIHGKMPNGSAPISENSELYAHIMRHAREFAAAGARVCQVRDFDDAADAACHVTHNAEEAKNARCAYNQYPQTSHERLFLPQPPRRADSKGHCQ